MRLRCSLVILAALVLCACASNSPASLQALPPISATDPAIIAAVKADRDASTEVYVRCLMRAAKRLDDRKSDPGTIAEAMISACSTEFDQKVRVYSRALDLDGEHKVAS
jgi:hypothetical protein